jgi:hypothetical protein
LQRKTQRSRGYMPAVTDSVYKGTKSEAEDLEWVGDSFSTWLQ